MYIPSTYIRFPPGLVRKGATAPAILLLSLLRLLP